MQVQAVEQNLDAQEARNVRLIREAFARQIGDGDRFYAILADDVIWTVALADNPSTYTSRQQFLEEGSGPITDRLSTPIRATVRGLYAACTRRGTRSSPGGTVRRQPVTVSPTTIATPGL